MIMRCLEIRPPLLPPAFSFDEMEEIVGCLNTCLTYATNELAVLVADPRDSPFLPSLFLHFHLSVGDEHVYELFIWLAGNT